MYVFNFIYLFWHQLIAKSELSSSFFTTFAEFWLQTEGAVSSSKCKFYIPGYHLKNILFEKILNRLAPKAEHCGIPHVKSTQELNVAVFNVLNNYTLFWVFPC